MPPSSLETPIVTDVHPENRTARAVRGAFEKLLAEGARLRPAGRARRDPRRLLLPVYLPRFELRLFEASFFLTGYRYDEALGFFVAYVGLWEGRRDRQPGRIKNLHPRIFYKDSSLVWRVASHFVHDHEEYWIGKGAVRVRGRGASQYLESAEETTNLPYEIQAALDELSRRGKKQRDDDAIELVLRQGPTGRLAPYADFVTPREQAAAEYRVNGGRSIARFMRRGDPTSLRFVRGFEPDFRNGVIEETHASSAFFGGALRKFRILSRNGVVQYLFVASPTHAWVNPPQAMTSQLSTYGVRTVDVLAPDDAFIPGYEYHEPEDDDESSSTHSQIPAGYAGPQHPDGDGRADASPWLEELPVIQEFRAKLLRRRTFARPSRNGRAPSKSRSAKARKR